MQKGRDDDNSPFLLQQLWTESTFFYITYTSSIFKTRNYFNNTSINH